MKYRPEIDGLRTLAVLSVIIYHAKFTLESGTLLIGGFLGVDIFFVISGFLITSLIMDEYQTTGRFSILNFYERRARRLLPALLIVILASLPYAWLYLLPNQLTDYSKSIIASIFFGSNFYWHYTLQEYGAESALLKPFLHTWSLAVEEQYYILFPLILIGIYKWFKSHTIALLTAGLLISLQFAEVVTNKDASFSFYMLPSRFWELLAGGLLANILYFHPQKDNDALLNRTMPILGLFLILHSVFFIEFNFNHPGFVTLKPVIGTMLIIWFANKDELTTKILSSKIFVNVGLISYSLYLWHYPIFAFGRINVASPSFWDKLAWIALTIILSITTYFLIEKPFRNRIKTGVRKLLIVLGITTSTALAVNFLIVANDGFPSRIPKIIANIETNVLNTRICKTFSCSFFGDRSKQIFLVGDSHMFPLEEPLLDFAKKTHFGLTILNEPGCQYILNLNRVNKKTYQKHKTCTVELQNKRRAVLMSAKPSIVIIGGRLPLILSEEGFNNLEGGNEGDMDDFLQYSDNSLKNLTERKSAIADEYRKTVMELANHGHKVVLIYPIPEVGWHTPKKIKKIFNRHPHSGLSILSEKPITTSYEVYIKRTKDSFSLLDGIQHENIVRIYPDKLFCDTSIKNRCVTHDLENAFYRDRDHLSRVGADMLMAKLAKTLIEIGLPEELQ